MAGLYVLIQCLWGAPQTLLGLLVFLSCRSCPHGRYRGAVTTRWRRRTGLSLGLFVFLPQEAGRRVLEHEYGHTLQSLALGPFYLAVVGLPSLIWAGLPALGRRRARRSISYYAFYTERWADAWGGVTDSCAEGEDTL